MCGCPGKMSGSRFRATNTILVIPDLGQGLGLKAPDSRNRYETEIKILILLKNIALSEVI